mgnify:CR=1 FL=1
MPDPVVVSKNDVLSRCVSVYLDMIVGKDVPTVSEP